MLQQLAELEQSIGYRFHNREHLRRALTCQSAINEHHADAANENFEVLEFLGDAALKYVVATLLYAKPNKFQTAGESHDKVCSHISNLNVSRIGRELNLSRYIIKGRGVPNVTGNRLANAVEAILGAIVVDQQQQENSSENALFDVIARLFSIERKGKSMAIPSRQNSRSKRCSCCKCVCIILIILVLLVMGIFIADKYEL